MIGRQPAFDIRDHGRILVRRAVQNDDELSNAIMDAAMASQRVWSPQEVDALNAQLDRCPFTIKVWLARLP
jgi:hypothetical protein